MNAPQIIFLVLLSMDVGIAIAKNGEVTEYKAVVSITSTIIIVLLLWWGGFWS